MHVVYYVYMFIMFICLKDPMFSLTNLINQPTRFSTLVGVCDLYARQCQVKNHITWNGNFEIMGIDNLKRFHIQNQVSSKTNFISSPNLYHRMIKKLFHWVLQNDHLAYFHHCIQIVDTCMVIYIKYWEGLLQVLSFNTI
jgi:hypothetical protein